MSERRRVFGLGADVLASLWHAMGAFVAVGCVLVGRVLGGCVLGGVAGCSNADAKSERVVDVDGIRGAQASAAKREEALRKKFPRIGLVEGVQLVVRASPDPSARALGWLRNGARVRLGDEKRKTSTCRSGWRTVAPRGYVCVGQGIRVLEGSAAKKSSAAQAAQFQPLPYAYYFVKEPMVPQYHQLPSRDGQRAARAFANEYLSILAHSESQAARFLAGEIPGQTKKPSVVSRYLNRGFFLAGTGIEVRSRRRFVRTVTGAYVKEARLEKRSGPSYQGIELGKADSGETAKLPIAFVLRAARLRKKRERPDGTVVWSKDLEREPYPRHTVLSNWRGRERFGERIMHVLQDEPLASTEPRYLRSWFVGVAEAIKPPFKIEKDEPWVHVDISEQTLVLYRGSTPVYATLVSTGLPGHDTPTGTFSIRRKLISATMANLGPDAGDDRYRVEDVPWTQYFKKSFAVHGAFWHSRFGLQRSHGCVNVSPADALRVFGETWPEVPPGWHGVSTDQTGFRTSRVHVTR